LFAPTSTVIFFDKSMVTGSAPMLR